MQQPQCGCLLFYQSKGDTDACRYPALLKAVEAAIAADKTANVDYGIAPGLERAMKGLRDAMGAPKTGGAE